MTIDANAMGKLLSMLAHDLRNPAATISANATFLREVFPTDGDEDIAEALADVELALRDLMQGFDHVAWLARSLAGQTVLATTDADVSRILAGLELVDEGIELRIEVPQAPMVARSAGALPKLLEALVSNSRQHARGTTVRVGARREGAEVVVEVIDTGTPVAPELRESCFTLVGQFDLKGRADGRYGRMAGLLAARIVADAMGARVEADELDGASVFRVRLAAVE